MTDQPSGKPEIGPDTIVAFIADIFKRRGAESYLGEQVTMSQHMLQAAQLAERTGCADDLIAAALLHDIGHYTSEFPDDAMDRDIDNRHEEAGARVLEPFFPATVTDCVRWHVDAKRYLCAVDPGYFERLSEASVHTLRLQGGPMTPEEVEVFSRHDNLDSIIQVRMWDEGAKDPTVDSPDFDHYAPLLQRLVDRRVSGNQRSV